MPRGRPTFRMLPTSWPNHSDVRPSIHLGNSLNPPREDRPQREQGPGLREVVKPSATLNVRGTVANHRNVCPHGLATIRMMPTSWPNHSDVRPSIHLGNSSNPPREDRPQREQGARAARSRQAECHAQCPWHRGQPSECLPTWPGNYQDDAHLVAESFRCSAIDPLEKQLESPARGSPAARARRRAARSRQAECHAQCPMSLAPWPNIRMFAHMSLATDQDDCPPRGRIIPMFGHRSTWKAARVSRARIARSEQGTRAAWKSSRRVPCSMSVAPMAEHRNVRPQGAKGRHPGVCPPCSAASIVA